MILWNASMALLPTLAFILAVAAICVAVGWIMHETDAS